MQKGKKEEEQKEEQEAKQKQKAISSIPTMVRRSWSRISASAQYDRGLDTTELEEAAAAQVRLGLDNIGKLFTQLDRSSALLDLEGAFVSCLERILATYCRLGAAAESMVTATTAASTTTPSFLFFVLNAARPSFPVSTTSNSIKAWSAY